MAGLAIAEAKGGSVSLDDINWEKEVNTVRDILARLRLNRPDLLAQAIPYDTQTGLVAKTYFEQHVMPNRLVAAGETNTPVSLIYVDIDHFKQFNDKDKSHAVGDKVLDGVVKTLQQYARVAQGQDVVSRGKKEVLARMGSGDEIAILLSGASLEQAMQIGERLRHAVATTSYDTSAGPKNVTISLGIAQYETGMEPVELMRRADTALYQSKAAGRNTVRLYLHSPEPAGKAA